MSVRRPAEWVGSLLAQEPLRKNFLRNYLSHTLPDFPAPRGHSSAAGVLDQNPRLSMRVCCRVHVSLRVNTCCVCDLSLLILLLLATSSLRYYYHFQCTILLRLSKKYTLEEQVLHVVSVTMCCGV